MIKNLNKIAFLGLLLFFFAITNSNAQNVSINEDGAAPDPSAMLDVSDTTKGFLPPRLNTTQMNAISSPATGLMVFNTDSAGYFYHDGVNWLSITSFSPTISTVDSVGESGVVLIKDVKTSGTAGGGFTSGSWLTRDLNNLEGDASFVSLVSNQFTLIPGVYFIEWLAPGFGVNRHKSQLFNLTSNSTQSIGSSEYASQINNGGNNSEGFTVIEIENNTTFRIEHFCETSKSNNGFGLNTSIATEIFTQVKIIKLDKVFGSGANSGQGASTTDTLSIITDADGDTKIQVEEGTDDDVIRFDIEGIENFRMNGGRLEVLNTGKSVFIGEGAGANDDLSNNDNTFVGYQAGLNNTSGTDNVFSGYRAGFNNTIGQRNVFSGHQVGFGNTTGGFNLFSGFQAGVSNTTGGSNVYLGYFAGVFNTTGSQNVLIGREAGRGASSHSKSGAVYIGFQAGYNDITDNKLYIENSNSATPLIYGDFANDELTFNATTKISSNTLGDAQLIIESDSDNNNENDNPSITLIQDGGGISSYIGIEGDADETVLNSRSNALLIGNIDGEKIQFFTDGKARLVIDDNSSNVGIGVNSPGWDLEIRDSTGNGSVHLATDKVGNDAYMEFENTLTEFTLRNDGGNGGKFVFESDNNGGTDIMVMEPTGNIGIGTLSPDSLLHVNGGARIDRLGINGQYSFPTTNGTGVLSNDGSGNLSWAAVSGADNLGNHTATTNINLAGNYLSGDGTAEGIHVDADGDVTVGASYGFSKFSVWDSNAVDLDISSITSTSEFGMSSYGNSNGGNELNFFRARGDRSTTTGVAYFDVIAQFNAQPHNGSSSFQAPFMTVRAVGTTGSIPTQIEFSTVDGSGNSDKRLVIESSGDVAIGQSYANYPLQLHSANDGVAFGITDANKGSNLTHAMLINNNNAIFQMKDSTASLPVYLNTSGNSWFTGGNVGIGTTSPTGFFTVRANGTGEDNGFKLLGNGGTKAVMLYSDGSGKIELANSGGTKNIKMAGGDNEDSYFNTGGNVGIGRTNPTYKLDVQGEVRANGTIGLYNSAEWDHLKLSHDGATAFIDAGGADAGMAFRTENTIVGYNPTYTEHMRILNNGNVGIGTSGPSSLLDVAGDIETGAADAFYFGDPSTNGTWRIVRDGNDLSFERRESGSWVFKMKIND